ncbi:MFS transporter [Pseudomonas sp. BNK-43-a]|uniref:MFS transporter n=1 Tax=unclassified Pseudomonas TaxID=196821 RepID=UPI0039BF3E73
MAELPLYDSRQAVPECAVPPLSNAATSAANKPSRLYSFALFIGIVGNALSLFTPISVGLSLKINELVTASERVAALGMVSGLGAFVALIANPFFGRMSDRTLSRFGRRRPWIVGGALLGFTGLITIAMASSVYTVGAGWSLAQMGFNAVMAAMTATVADQVEKFNRGKMSGIIGMGVPVGMALGAGLSSLFVDIRWMITVPAVTGITCIFFFALTLKDKPLTERPAPFTLKQLVGTFFFSPREHPDFAWVCMTKFLFMCAYAAGTGYIAYFLLSELHIEAHKVAGIIFMTLSAAMGGALLTSPLGGWLSDRYQVRKPFVVVSAIIAMAGLIITGNSDTVPILVFGQLVLGLGVGCFNAVDLAMATDTLPDDDNKAKNLGIFNIFATLPQALIPVMAAPIIALFGFGALYTSAACVGLAGALLVFKVKTTN